MIYMTCIAQTYSFNALMFRIIFENKAFDNLYLIKKSHMYLSENIRSH